MAMPISVPDDRSGWRVRVIEIDDVLVGQNGFRPQMRLEGRKYRVLDVLGVRMRPQRSDQA